MKQEWKIVRHIVLGYDADGKRIRKRIYANTEIEFRKKYAELVAEYQQYKNPSEITFQKYAEQWNEVFNAKKSPKTYEYYTATLNKFSAINNKKLREITKTDLQVIINSNSEHPRTCKKIQQVAYAMFECAIDDGIILTNPAKHLTLPEYKASEKRAFTPEEIKAIKNLALDSKRDMAVKMMFYLGLRPEELRALTIDDINFDTKELTINKVAAHLKDGYVSLQNYTKNKKDRTIPIPDALFEELKNYECNHWLFPMATQDAPMTQSSWRRFSDPIFQQINELLGGDELNNKLNGMTWYTFRHNRGTELYYVDGLSSKFKAYILGHSEQVFLSTYSHLKMEKEDISIIRKITL